MVSATVNKNHRENAGNLVSMETEGNIPCLFLDGSFIISIFEKRFFKVIETIKYSQLFIAMETESVGLQCFFGPADFSGREEDTYGEGSGWHVETVFHNSSSLKLFSQEPDPHSFLSSQS